ncbi:MAG: AMMECR1 domain-containing protein, partial [Candidatus Cloacimonas sp.]|nr:AMMECR1 domain-containing protein [Candidatus Cloacimonas sp.]
MMFSIPQKQTLLALARDAIISRLQQKKLSLPMDEDFSHKRGVFVSLHAGGELRGCIGYIKGYKSISASVAEMAVAAAFNDPRFAPLD